MKYHRREFSFRTPAKKKLICAKRTSYKLAVWFYSDNDCTINNRLWFIPPSILLVVALPVMAKLSRSLVFSRTKSYKNFLRESTEVFLYFFIRFRLILERRFCTTNYNRKLCEYKQSHSQHMFDYAKCNPSTMISWSLSQQTKHDLETLKLPKSFACSLESMHLVRVCCLEDFYIPRKQHKDASHSLRCLLNSRKLQEHSLRMLKEGSKS